VRNEVLYRVEEERNSLHAIKRRKIDCIGHILHRNCFLFYFIYFLRHIIEGKIEEGIEVTGRQGR
jgi:hypothetical protein